MLSKVQQIVPISEMKLNQPQVLDLLGAGPVVLANRSRPAAVLVSIEQWDKLIERLEDQSDIIDALQMKLDIARGDVEVETFTADQLNQFIGADDRVPA